MAFLLNSVKSCVKYMTQTITNQSLAYTQTRFYKAEVFHHSRGVLSNDLSQRGRHYKPKIMPRMSKHGLSKRLETRGGKQILWRKLLKGPTGWVNLVPAP